MVSVFYGTNFMFGILPITFKRFVVQLGTFQKFVSGLKCHIYTKFFAIWHLKTFLVVFHVFISYIINRYLWTSETIFCALLVIENDHYMPQKGIWCYSLVFFFKWKQKINAFLKLLIICTKLEIWGYSRHTIGLHNSESMFWLLMYVVCLKSPWSSR